MLLTGQSELDCILEYASERHGLCFAKGADASNLVTLAMSADTIVVLPEELDGHDIAIPEHNQNLFPMERVLVPGIGL